TIDENRDRQEIRRRRAADSIQRWSAQHLLSSVKRHEFGRWRAEEMAPQLRQLLARLCERAVSHLRNARSVIQSVAAFRRGLIDAPDRFALMHIAGDDLGGTQSAVRLAGHEEPRH